MAFLKIQFSLKSNLKSSFFAVSFCNKPYFKDTNTQNEQMFKIEIFVM